MTSFACMAHFRAMHGNSGQVAPIMTLYPSLKASPMLSIWTLCSVNSTGSDLLELKASFNDARSSEKAHQGFTMSHLPCHNQEPSLSWRIASAKQPVSQYSETSNVRASRPSAESETGGLIPMKGTMFGLGAKEAMSISRLTHSA